MTAAPSRLRFAQSPGPWLWAALALGAGIRIFLVLATEGTDDVPIWQSHAGWAQQYGLAGYYQRSEVFNHPPFIGKLLSGVWVIARNADIPFRIPLRGIFALVDAVNALLLFSLFAASPWRYLVLALYWLNPLAIIFSAYHGNTDTGVACFILLAIAAAAKGRAAAAGAAIGVGLWIKLPVILAAPALFFALAGWRKRAAFAAAALCVGAATYLPTALEAPDLVYRRVIAYPGLFLHTPGGDPVWGIWYAFPLALRRAAAGVIASHAVHNTLVTLIPIVVFSWLRRRETDARGLGATVCGAQMIFYGITLKWAYQYLAWSIPLWYFVGPGFAAAATVVLGAFIYGLYAFLCDSLLLLGPWQYARHPFWPTAVVRLRDTAVLFCFAAAAVFLGRASLREWRLSRPAATAAGSE
jgi:hypothetical protein